MFQFKNLSGHNISHFITTTKGGVSEGNYSSNNLGKYAGDLPERVTQNRSRLFSELEIQESQFYSPYQTHGDKIIVIDSSFAHLDEKEKEARLNGFDALITNLTKVCIGITTADCVPILMYDYDKKVIAAIHAGWKGTILNIAAKSLKCMQKIFNSDPRNILVGIGPAISPEIFEVGNEVADKFEKVGFNMETISFIHKMTGKVHLDLWKANEIKLIEAGIPKENIETLQICTYSNPETLFSARRQGIQSGRMLSGIMLQEQIT